MSKRRSLGRDQSKRKRKARSIRDTHRVQRLQPNDVQPLPTHQSAPVPVYSQEVVEKLLDVQKEAIREAVAAFDTAAKKYYQVYNELLGDTTAIMAAAHCNNGENTRRVLQTANGDLLKHLYDFDTCSETLKVRQDSL